MPSERTKVGGKPARRLPNYNLDEESWPLLWRLPHDDMQAPADDDDDAERATFTKFATTADDIALREMVHIWDNCMRWSGAWGGILGGMLAAHARLAVSLNEDHYDIERAADAVREAWLGMARQAQRVKVTGSWDSGEAN